MTFRKMQISDITFFGFASAVFLVATGVFFLQWPFWGDEQHFIETIRLFGHLPLFEVIRDYPEVTTPLFYFVFASWGHFFDFSVSSLRIFSLVIAWINYLMLFVTVSQCIKDKRLAILVCLSVLLNPYILGLSIFVFTDMLTLLFVLVSVSAYARGHMFVCAFSIACAMLCRQYAVIFLAAMFSLEMWRMVKVPFLIESTKGVLLLSFAAIPLCLLFLLWGGISPPSGVAKWVMVRSVVWKPHALLTYIGFLSIYLIPFFILTRFSFSRTFQWLLLSFVLGGTYFIFGIEPSAEQRANGIDTVGLAHRLIKLLAAHVQFIRLEGIVLYVSISFGFYVLITIIRDDVRKLSVWQGSNAHHFVLSLSLYLFLVVMPFSYQIWEKYLVMILPFVMMRLTLVGRDAPSPAIIE